MGCVCCSLSSFISILLDALERISLCTVCAMLTCCLLFTIMIVLVLGVGIGFHYCFVQNSVDAMAKAAKAAGALRSGGGGGGGAPPAQRSNVMRSLDRAFTRGLAYRQRERRDIDFLLSNGTYNGSSLDHGTYSDSKLSPGIYNDSSGLNYTNYYNDSDLEYSIVTVSFDAVNVTNFTAY